MRPTSNSRNAPQIARTLMLSAVLSGLVLWTIYLQEGQRAHHVQAGTIAGEDLAPAGGARDTAPAR